ncbi:hypothetical protein BC830DRAFT_1227102 [Chytriomyces sp. MP71]|nr:hypothetical protein BC830DRAFT_1227102 [Chytriomyces sp. MP71]
MSASDSDSDLHPLPANLNRVGLSPNVSAPTRSLAITTYGHRFGPLNGPQPDLIFNARTLPNPPKHIRASWTGLSKSLQESFLSSTLCKLSWKCNLILRVGIHEALTGDGLQRQ